MKVPVGRPLPLLSGTHSTRLEAASSGCLAQWPASFSLFVRILVEIFGRSRHTKFIAGGVVTDHRHTVSARATLTLTWCPWYTNPRIPWWRCILRAEINFLGRGFQKLSFDTQTDISNCDNCVELFGRWQQKLLKQWYKNLSAAVSTTVTHCYTTIIIINIFRVA